MLDLKIDVESEAALTRKRSLQLLIADTAVAAAKAQTYQWNVSGAPHGPEERLFRSIFIDHRDANDDLAERIRALGGRAEGRPSTLAAQSRLNECAGAMPDSEMVAALIDDQVSLAAACRALAAEALADNDPTTADLAVERADRHEGFARALRSPGR